MPLVTPSLMSRPSPKLRSGDFLGFWLASVCALHCALLPVAFAAVPAGALGALGGGDVDQALVVFAAALGLLTLTAGYRHHRRAGAWPWLVAGLMLLVGGAFGPWHVHDLAHALVMVSGGLLLATAHWMNLRLTRMALSSQSA